MKIGLGLGISRLSSGGPSGPVSLYDTSDFSEVSGDFQGDEIIDADSFRLARPSGSSMPVYEISDGGVNGAKTITFTTSDYDGSASGITIRRIQVLDGATLVQNISTTGEQTINHTFVSGSIVFRSPTAGRGIRADDLMITAA